MSDSSQGLSAQERRQLIQALQACTIMQDAAMRDEIVNELRADIRTRVKRHASIQLDVRNIVSTSLNFPGGLDELIEIVRMLEGDTLQMQAVDVLVSGFAKQEQAPAPPAAPLSKPGRLTLYGAIPADVSVGQTFGVALRVSQLGGMPLTAATLADLPGAQTGAADDAQITLTARVLAPDCKVDNPEEQPVTVGQGRDSDVAMFKLAPLFVPQTERTRVTITLALDGNDLGSIDLYTNVFGNAVGQPNWTISQLMVPTDGAMQRFLRTLIAAQFPTVADTEMLAVNVGLGRGYVSGNTPESRALSLVQQCAQRGTLDKLVEQSHQLRPQANWVLLPDLT